MILSFKDETTALVFEGRRPKGLPADIFRIARRTLGYLDAATNLEDLATPPGNRLHAFVADRAGQHAISINDKYRICFTWTEAGPKEVEIVDYH